jgi:hypothetical protein
MIVEVRYFTSTRFHYFISFLRTLDSERRVEGLLTEGPLVKAAVEATRERTATVFMVVNYY